MAYYNVLQNIWKTYWKTERVFNILDDDGNGTIDFVEFITNFSITSRGEIDEKLACKFLK